MESITLRSHVGEDGILQVSVPDQLRNQDLEIMIIFQPIDHPESRNDAAVLDSTELRGWNPGFFETVVGSWEGEALERPAQLPFEMTEDAIFERDNS